MAARWEGVRWGSGKGCFLFRPVYCITVSLVGPVWHCNHLFGKEGLVVLLA